MPTEIPGENVPKTWHVWAAGKTPERIGCVLAGSFEEACRVILGLRQSFRPSDGYTHAGRALFPTEDLAKEQWAFPVPTQAPEEE